MDIKNRTERPRAVTPKTNRFQAQRLATASQDERVVTPLFLEVIEARAPLVRGGAGVSVKVRSTLRVDGSATIGHEIVPPELPIPILAHVLVEELPVLLADGTTVLSGNALERGVARHRSLALLQEADGLIRAPSNLERVPNVLVRHDAPPVSRFIADKIIYSNSASVSTPAPTKNHKKPYKQAKNHPSPLTKPGNNAILLSSAKAYL